MRTKLFILAAIITITGVFSLETAAQVSRKAVSGAEVTGTFRSSFGGKFKGSYSEIKIAALGGGKLRVSFSPIYPYIDRTGELGANVGEAAGEADISGDTAVYRNDEFGACTITLKFVKPGQLVVTQEGTDADCGFGHNVSAGGTYKKFSGVKPSFD